MDPTYNPVDDLTGLITDLAPTMVSVVLAILAVTVGYSLLVAFVPKVAGTVTGRYSGSVDGPVFRSHDRQSNAMYDYWESDADLGSMDRTFRSKDGAPTLTCRNCGIEKLRPGRCPDCG